MQPSGVSWMNDLYNCEIEKVIVEAVDDLNATLFTLIGMGLWDRAILSPIGVVLSCKWAFTTVERDELLLFAVVHYRIERIFKIMNCRFNMPIAMRIRVPFLQWNWILWDGKIMISPDSAWDGVATEASLPLNLSVTATWSFRGWPQNEVYMAWRATFVRQNYFLPFKRE